MVPVNLIYSPPVGVDSGDAVTDVRIVMYLLRHFWFSSLLEVLHGPYLLLFFVQCLALSLEGKACLGMISVCFFSFDGFAKL